MSNPKVRVQFARLEDLQFVSQDGYLSEDVLKRKIEGQEVVIAKIDGQPVGYVRLDFIWSEQPFMALIRVVPEFRKIGVGKAILHFLKETLSVRGIPALFSSSQSNEPDPQEWHRHVGFKDCGALSGLNKDGSDEVFFKLTWGRHNAYEEEDSH